MEEDASLIAFRLLKEKVNRTEGELAKLLRDLLDFCLNSGAEGQLQVSHAIRVLFSPQSQWHERLEAMKAFQEFKGNSDDVIPNFPIALKQVKECFHNRYPYWGENYSIG